MGYIFLIIALFAGVTKGYCGKKISGHASSFRLSVLASTIRMLLCIVIGFIVILLEGNLSLLLPEGKVLLISALSGISTAVFVVTWLVSVRKSAYMLIDVFLMLGVLVPLMLDSVFFQGTIRPVQWIGLAILFIATFIMCSYNNSIKTKLTFSTFLLLVLCGVSNGITDFSQKLFIRLSPDFPASVFNLYTYIFASMTLVAAYLLLKKEDAGKQKDVFNRTFVYVAIMAVALFVNSYFKTRAAVTLSAILLYPLNQGCALILASIMAAVVFKEKLTAKAIVGILISFIGLFIINIL